MKVVETANGKKNIIISKKEWTSLGKTAGWFSSPKIPAEGEFGYGLNAEAMKMLAKYQIGVTDLFRYDTPNSFYPDIYNGIQEAKKGNNEPLKKALVAQFEKR